MMINRHSIKHHAAAFIVGVSVASFSPQLFAQQAQGAANAKPQGPIICPGYERGKTNLVGERTGKKVQRAFEAYNEDLIDEALEILIDIEASDTFDRAYVDRFIGNIMASDDKKGQRALGYLESAVKETVLNDSEHAGTLKLIGDLSMQEKEYLKAVDYYAKWMEFTCKSDPDVYTRMAQAFYESKKFAEMIEPADKAIALYEEPNKNPYILKLTSYYERKMLKEAVGVAEQLVINFPSEPRWWPQLGNFYLAVEDYDKALSTMDVAYLQGYLEKESEIRTLAQLYAATGAPHRAARLTEKHIKSGLLKKDAESLANLAKTFHQARDFKTAANYFGEAAKLSSDPEHFEQQGTLLLVAEDYSGAIDALKSALDRGAEEAGKIHYALMEANFYVGNFRTAYQHAQEAKKDRGVRRNANAWIPYIETKAKNRGISL